MFYSLFVILLPLLLGVGVCVLFDYLEQTKFKVRGVVGPYFASIALVFGLFASLMASETWQKTSRINGALTTEMSSLRGLLRIAEVITDQKSYVKTAVMSYVTIISTSELKDGPSAGVGDSDESVAVIRGLFQFAANPANFGGNAVLNKTFIDELNKVRSARLERRQVEESQASALKLNFLTLFGLLTQLAIALCHTGQRRASWATVMLFSVAFSASMSMITLIDNPVASRLVSSKPLTQVH